MRVTTYIGAVKETTAMITFSEGPPDGQWQGVDVEQAQQWQQLKLRHYLALLDLRRQQADWSRQLLELKVQLAEIQALHQTHQLAKQQLVYDSQPSNASSLGGVSSAVDKKVDWKDRSAFRHSGGPVSSTSFGFIMAQLFERLKRQGTHDRRPLATC